MPIKRNHSKLSTLVLLILPLATEAHTLHWTTESESLIEGLLHPLTSSDHILTMLAVGLWISQKSKSWIYLLPIAFVSLMLLGGTLPLLAIEIYAAKYIMYFSVLALGIMLAMDHKTPEILGGLIVASVAFFHGYVHVYDMLLDVEGSGYMTGFAVTTLLLIVTGVIARKFLNLVTLKLDTHF